MLLDGLLLKMVIPLLRRRTVVEPWRVLPLSRTWLLVVLIHPVGFLVKFILAITITIASYNIVICL